MSAGAGWFADPAGAAATFRWWDGSGWTRWLSRDAAAPPPVVEAGPGVPDSPPTEPPTEPPTRPADLAPPDAGPTVVPATVRLPLAVVLTVAALVLSLIVVGVTVTLTTRSPVGSGPPVAPPPRDDTSTVRYDPGTRTASYEEMHLQLAGDPYRCATTPTPIAPILDTGIACDVVVHADYAATHDWSASLGIGKLAGGLVERRDLERTGEQVMASIRRSYYAQSPTRLANVRYERTRVGPARTVGVVSGEIHYAIKGLPSRYDRALLVVVALDSGDYGLVYSLRPDDLPAPTLDALEASLDTFGVD